MRQNRPVDALGSKRYLESLLPNLTSLLPTLRLVDLMPFLTFLFTLVSSLYLLLARRFFLDLGM